MFLPRERCTFIPAILLISSLAISPVFLQSVTLFKNKNFGGPKCDIQVQGCKPVCPELKSQASSLQMTANCANFYRREGCTAYMGTWSSNMGEIKNLKHKESQDSIMSVGDCSKPIPENTVTFYQHKHYHGKSCTLQVNEGCQPMCPELDNLASSAEGNAACIETYDDPNCHRYVGDLIDFKIGGYRDFEEWPKVPYGFYQDKISSVKLCSMNRTATFYESTYQEGKFCTIPLNKGCQPMCPELKKEFHSMNATNSCVRTWSEPNCKGEKNEYLPPVNRHYHYAASVEDCVDTDRDRTPTRLDLRRPDIWN
ncbi:unnamed protein product [Bemisia tabaci]|uniref:Uncharacterized protein n=1 Tax=Bemisia tabaci TaxID=7038 RepID=A0A9P0A4Z4_BEMTA|nr:unnamed protein product [Bemisia tabaci]